MIEKGKALFKKYELYVSPVTLVIGFAFDNLTLSRIDVLSSNLLLISYLIISALSILILNIRESRREAGGEGVSHILLIFMLQFCLGGLFSASFLFYSKSGTLIGSWPFLLMLIVYIVGNEFLRKNYVRLSFQIAVFFTALFSYLIFFLPIILGKMNDAIFLLSGIASLVMTGLFIYVMSWFVPERTSKSAPMIMLSVGTLFTVMNVLYFTNLIPPIPLALKEVGAYQSLVRHPDGTYQVVGEKQNWLNKLSRRHVVHIEQGKPLYVLSAVFAPANLATDIVHIWQYYDSSQDEWITASKIDLGISGGRDNGFRTFSVKENIFPGRWRVNVETPRGQLIGRISFSIAFASGNEIMVSSTK